MFKFPISRFIVYDRSMEPRFHEYDRVFTLNFVEIQKGSVVVFKDSGKYYIKRVKNMSGDNIEAISDNKKLAKKVWKLKRDRVIGRVFLKY